MNISGLKHIISGLTIFVASMMLAGCFTGVESTPKIKASEVKRHDMGTKEEKSFLSDIRPEAPVYWKEGKKFYVTNPKIALLFNEITQSRPLQEGDYITFLSMTEAPSITDRGATVITFVTPDGREVIYRVEMPLSKILENKKFTIPFTIEQSIVDAVGERLKGKKYYITTPSWLPDTTVLAKGISTPSANMYVAGLRHVPVEITDVTPGNEAYPVSIVFKELTGAFPGKKFKTFMTAGSDNIATRNFEMLFAFDNPRKKYPRITDEVWKLIINSRVQAGMTRDECRLALGAPIVINYLPYSNSEVEHWSYDNGIFLEFKDGLLNRFRR